MKSTIPPRPSPSRRARREPGARRRGQALLLAVLLMVFAALLGATMITLVSSNLSQTTRQGGLSAARSSSTAAIAFVNNSLTNSIQGDMWRPWQDNKPPLKATDPAGFNAYYTAFERAKGWVNEVDFNRANLDTSKDYNGNGITYATATATATLDPHEQESEYNAWIDTQIISGKSCFVKFPDPRGPATNASGPQYLIQVSPAEFVQAGSATPASLVGTPTGSLKITVIGTSEDEPGAFDKRDILKPTTARSGPFSFARFDSNYNYKGKGLARTRLTKPITAATTTLDVESTVGLGRGRTIIVSDLPSQAQAVMVRDADPVARTITLSTPLTPPASGYQEGTVIAAASPLMDGIRKIDFDAEGDGTKGSGWEDTLTKRSGTGGILFNGGATLEGKTTLTLGGAGSLNPSVFSVAGLIAPRPATPTDEAVIIDAGAALPTPTPLSDSDDSVSGLVRDNRNPEMATIKPLTPPSIDGPDSRYRELTQFADISGGSTYGYGPGVYIANTSDIEKAGVGGSPLTLTQSHQLYANKYLQYVTPATPTTNTLEDRHIRGWVSPWEFRPRGTLIELKGNKIIFTLDDRSDVDAASALFHQPNPAKAWKGSGGAALTTPGASTYRMVLDVRTGLRSFGAPGAEVAAPGATPFNGAILLEGNARVRGYLQKTTGATTVRGCDLTIASMGSIFIEGSVVRDASTPATMANPPASAPRLALLAKRDVVLNLTQALAHVSGTQDRDVTTTTLLAPANAGAKTVTVNNVDVVRVGDIIRVANDHLWHQVTAIDSTKKELSFNVGLGTAGVANDLVRRLSDPDLQTYTNPDTVSPETFYDSAPPTIVAGASNNTEVFARDINLDGVDAASTYRLSWLHAGQQREAVAFERPTTATTPGTFHTRNKAITPAPMPAIPSNVIRGVQATNEKRFFASGDTTTPAQPDVNDVDLLDLDADGTRGDDTTETLTKLQGLFPPPTPPIPAAPAPQGPTWVVNIKAGLEQAPARRLAAIGATVGSPADPTVAPGSKYSIPLALSGGWYFQAGLNADLLSLLSPVGAATKPVAWRAIGASTLLDGDDDLESTQESFYQRNGSTTPVQAPMLWSKSPDLTPGTLATDRPNIVAFSQDIDPIPSAPVPATPVVPNYRFGMPKIEADDFAVARAAPAFVPVPFYIQATIFAQEGSWFVTTPAPNSIPDIDGSSVGVPPPFVPNAPDLAAATRYRRLNYQVVVKGTIVQNFAASGMVDLDSAGAPTTGAVLSWSDAFSRPTNIGDGGAGPGFGRGQDWQSIEYQADPLPLYNNLYLPPTPDLIYTS